MTTQSNASSILKERYSEIFRFYVPSVQASFLTSADLDRFIEARFDFFQKRKDEVKIDIHNPGVEFYWLVNSTVVEITLPDSRFIVETLIDYCTYHEYQINMIIHPLFHVERGKHGELLALESVEARSDAPLETQIYLEINRLEADEMESMQRDLLANFVELRTIVSDYENVDKLLSDFSSGQDDETRAVLSWLREYFVLLGAAQTDRKQIEADTPVYGIFRHEEARTSISRELQQNGLSNSDASPIIFLETQTFSNVNKRKPYYLIVLRNGDRSAVIAGHFTQRAETMARTEIPYVRRQVEQLLKRFRASSTSYTRKEIYRISNLLPVALFFTRPRLLEMWFDLIISNLYASEVDFSMDVDPDYNMVWVAAVIPNRDSGNIPTGHFYHLISQEAIQIVHHVRRELNRNSVLLVGINCGMLKPGTLIELFRKNQDRLFSSWTMRFRRLVYNKYVGDRRINLALQRYFSGMSPDYEIHQEPDEALFDLDTLESMTDESEYQVRYYHGHGNSRYDYIKIYAPHANRLSDLVPVLSDFGFTIEGDFTFPYRTVEFERFTYAFRVPPRAQVSDADRRRIADAIEAALNEHTTCESLNQLVLDAGLTARELNLVKAFCAFYFQIDKSFSRISLNQRLLAQPDFIRALTAYFHARLGPDASTKQEQAALAQCESSFAAIESVLDETLCRSFLNIVQAIVRTTYYLQRSEIAFKIHSKSIDLIPEPVPLFEIFVYGYDLEGVHLRGGLVARGGIRWSDRSDDFRTEVLGLMKAQMVKNTVIVPVGSKGGFVLKNRTFADRTAFLEAGQAAYKRYIGQLLDLTDNLDRTGQQIAATNIRRLDANDSYLVVAADKGTATFSDLANRISTDRGFWLGDAFASGGAHGYDHKVQGITARGAWESVRRHFYEMNMDPDRDAIRAVGIGDMGGDVFGNGMLLSSSMLLVAAFNHMYIFLDPTPDAAQAYAERRRMFEHGLNWNEYDPDLISRGGGVFNRNSKRIELSNEARQVLGIRSNHLSGEELIQSILRAPVDLLWNGGIGTYIKSSQESHFQARDPANDRVRINGNEVRAKVVGEGGNLGLTQAARLEAAQGGVRLNTDAIDNSAGVDMSDHEVNLKILLNMLIREKQIADQEERNSIIRKYEQDEITLVLNHNVNNNLALSLDVIRAPRQFVFFRALIRYLNVIGLINRQADNVPFEHDLDRLEQGTRNLSRPLLCSLMGFTKLHLEQVLLESKSFNEDWYDDFIMNYFPIELAAQFKTFILRHPLKREIIITEIVNHIVNNAGIAFFQRMFMAGGKPIPAIAETYMRLSRSLNLTEIRAWIHPKGVQVPVAIEYEYLIQLEEKFFRINRRMLDHPELLREFLELDHVDVKQTLNEARKHSTYRPSREMRARFRQMDRELTEQITEAFRLADVLEDAVSIVLGRRHSRSDWTIARYFHVVEMFHIQKLRRIVSELHPESSWEILFLSRVDERIERFLMGLLDAGYGRGSRPDETREKIHRMVEDIFSAHSNGSLTTAVLYEMLEFMIRQLQSRVVPSHS